MSIFGAEAKNLSKQMKIKRLQDIAQVAEADLDHSEANISAKAYYIIGRCLLEQGKVSKAAEHLETANEKQGQCVQYKAVLAKAYLMLRHEANCACVG